jgi:hypothetical protein
VRVLSARDFQKKECAPWVAPDGAQFLELPYTLVFPILVPAGATLPAQLLATRFKYPFELDQVSLHQPQGSDVYGRFQWPNGRFSSQVPEDLTQFYGLGQYAALQDPPVQMPPGSVIRILQLQNVGGVDAVLYLHFEGVVRIPLVPGVPNAA